MHMPARLRSLWGAAVLAAALPAAWCNPDTAGDEPADTYLPQLASLINGYRAAQGLAPLTLVDGLSALAAEHSAHMARQQQMSHDGFASRFQRAASASCVENLAWNHPTPQSLLLGWQQSPDHDRHLLAPGVARMGLARIDRYVTFLACR